jgi:predicted nuclease of predicted toxin-antitoxin system
MRLLIDECLPRQLKSWLAGAHEVMTVQEMGWANVKNGALLRAANEAGFDVFVTADKNMYYQQNFATLELATIVIPSNRKLLVQKSVPALLQSLERIQPRQKVIIELGPNIAEWESSRLHAIEPAAQHTSHVFKI